MRQPRTLFAAFVLVGALTWAGCGGDAPTTGKPGGGPGGPGGGRGGASAAVAVEVGDLTLGTIADEAQYPGSLLPRQRFVVAPKVAGRLKRLTVNVGDQVRKGQLIAEIDDDEQLQALSQAEAELQTAKAAVLESEAGVDTARRESVRVLEMRKQKISSASDAETAEAALKMRLARHEINLSQVRLKEAQVRAAQVRLSYTKIAALWNDDGEVRHIGERFQDEGSMLAANTPIVSILDLNTVVGVLDVVERDYPKLKVGQPAEVVAAALPDRRFPATIARVAPFLNAATRQARVEIDIANPGFVLTPGMFVTARIAFASRAGATLAPASAVARRGGLEGLFLVDPEGPRARFVPIKLGMVQQDLAEVVSPPLTGRVVTLGQHLLEDGALLVVAAPEKAAQGGPARPRGPGRRTGAADGGAATGAAGTPARTAP